MHAAQHAHSMQTGSMRQSQPLTSNTAPPNSQTAATRMACFIVSALAPVEGKCECRAEAGEGSGAASAAAAAAAVDVHIRWPSRALTDTGAEGIGHLDRGRGKGGWAGSEKRQEHGRRSGSKSSSLSDMWDKP